MKVLVTGATAPVGLAIIDALRVDPGVELVLACGLEATPPERLRARGIVYHACDLGRARACHDLLYGDARDLAIDTVIHGPLHRSARDAGRRVHAVNVEATRQLVLGSEHHPTIKRFVYRSVADVYAVRSTEPNLLDEDAPLELDPAMPQWTRDRLEADLVASTRFGRSQLAIAVLRCAEVLARDTGSQLWDYLQTRVCLRPLGFDPMINVLSLPDLAHAMVRAARSKATGIFNIPGADTLPLSGIIARAHRLDVPVPGPLLAPLYQLRARTVGLEFRYDLNMRRFHFGGILDGTRAREILGYAPAFSIWRGPANAEAPRRLFP